MADDREMPLKWCSRCGLTKPISEFYRHAGKRDGRASPCKACRKAEPPEAGKASAARHRARHKERLKREKHEYYERNKERIREKERDRPRSQRVAERERRWHEANQARNQELQARWHADNPGASRRIGATRRARRARAFVEHVDPYTVYTMHGGRCGICGDFITGAFHVDHVVPLSRGGLHCYANAQPAHPVCNARKGSKMPTMAKC
jgi:5-methylcytosine-specific restriction endonuclease McrA